MSAQPTPPKWAVRFFQWYCHDRLSDAILGDMIELHARRFQSLGKRRANLLFIWNVLLFCQPFTMRKKSASLNANQLAMLKNYFVIAWRTMSRQKMYSAIKVGGFALGLSTCFLIFLFIRDETSYDQGYKEGARIFRVYNEVLGHDEKYTSFPANIAEILRTEFPEVEKSGRLIPWKWFNAGSNLFRRDDRVENTYEEGFAYADQDLLEILEVPMVYGNLRHALDKPYTIVLSKSKADKYFPGEDPVGKVVIFNEDKSKPYTVGGVMEDFPGNSHLHYDFFITLTGVEFWPGEQTSWCCWNYSAYVRLRPEANPADLEKKLLSIKKNYYLSYLIKTGNQYAEDVRKYHVFRLQPVRDIYLQADNIEDNLQHGDQRYVWLFGGIAVFILLLACINFINLSTAKSANRAKEVGLRKVVGSVRGHLIRQFLIESLSYSFISFGLGLVLVWVALPFFNVLANKSLSIPWTFWPMYPFLLISALLTGILAGIYPSFYLSAFNPIDVLKGAVSRGSKTSGIRNALVIFQFTTSIILIIGTIIIYQQMNFILRTKVGFDKDQVIMIHGTNTLNEKQSAFKDELLRVAAVQHVTMSNYFPVAGTNRDQNEFWREGKSKEELAVGAQMWRVDPDYIPTMGMTLMEGRNFIPGLASDSQAIIINQTMAKRFGFKKPLGERIMNSNTYTVIGVVDDFHFESLKGRIGPLAMALDKGGSVACVKVNTKDMQGTIQAITRVWNEFLPHQPFRYTFLNESYARMYADVERMGQIFASFSLLAIIVACLGLFALSAFMVEQRSKEVSIRLVLGASVSSIFQLLTSNFVRLVAVSFVVAAPVAWYMMKKWLEDYTYKINIGWEVFALAGIISLIIALFTISYQSIRAALTNPANHLRSE
jgi:putative ABC transport system permease protein